MVNTHKIKQDICAIGDRLYKKGFAAANDGNISVRIAENEVICTPTMMTKGFMKPDDLCTVDMEGNQLSGRRKRTSEVMLHLAIMKARPEIKSVVHCHPPHATAFGIAREPVPQCVLPEVEIFIGDVPIAAYAIPGGQEFADTILPFIHQANVMILANHGTVSYDVEVEKAYWWTEILDAYCRMLMLARGLGRVSYFNEPEAEALMDLKEKWGYRDPRAEVKNCELCANDTFRESWKETGVRPGAFQPPLFHGERSGSASSGNGTPTPPAPVATPDQEALIRTITDRVMAALNQR